MNSCVIGLGKSDMWGEKVSPAQGACANQNACTVVNQGKKLSKTLQKDLK